METEYKILAGIIIMFFAGFALVAWSLIPKPVPFEQLPIQEQMSLKNVSFYQVREVPNSAVVLNSGVNPDLKKLLDQQQNIANNNSAYQQFGKIG